MTKTNINPHQHTLKMALHGLFVQIYSLVVWLLILAGGMVVVSGFFVPDLQASELVSGLLVGIVSVGFGIGSARLLNKDIRQTAPVIWF